jgi:hypothetical protein
MIHTAMRWFKRSTIKKVFAGLFAIISLAIFSIVLIASTDIRLLLPKSPSEPLTKEQWMEDFDFLDESLQTHPAYNDSLGLKLNEFKSEIATLPTVSNHRAFVTTMKMVNLFQDGHSQVVPLPLYIKRPKYLPIQTHIFSDGLYITNSSNDKDLIGGRIISINSQPIEAIIDKVSKVIGSDNAWGMKFHSGLYLTNMDVLKGLDIISSTDQASVEIRINGKLITKELKAVSAIKWFIWSLAPLDDQRPVSWNIRTAKTNVEVKNNSLIWMTFNQTKSEELLTTIGNQIYHQAYDKSIKHLVIDMRNNTGGNNETYNDLIKSLVDTKIDITVLTSRKTFSAGINFISELQLARDFRIIGEPTGAGHNHYGDPQTLFLPNSGLMLTLSTRTWNFFPELSDKTIIPDLFIEYSSSDYFTHNDPWMKALEMDGKKSNDNYK